MARSVRLLRIDGCTHQCIDEALDYLEDACLPDGEPSDTAMLDIEDDELHTPETPPVQEMTDYEMEDVILTSTVTSVTQVLAPAPPSRDPITRSRVGLPKPTTANAAAPFVMTGQAAGPSSSHTAALRSTPSSSHPSSSTAKSESTGSSVMQAPIPPHLSTNQMVSDPAGPQQNAPPKPATANAVTHFTMNGQMAQPHLLSVPT